MSKYVDGIEFITEECCSCGMPFAMTKGFYDRRRNDHKSFYCPAGHSQHYTGKSEAQRLKDKLAAKQEQLTAQNSRAARLEREKEKLSRNYKKMRDRVKNGVCPCCNRTFRNLLNHMRTEHPDFESNEVARNLRDAYGLSQSDLGEEIGVPASYISLYENNKVVPEWAKNVISNWVEENG